MLPALSYHFGLRWEHIHEMPAGELESYLEALREISKGR